MPECPHCECEIEDEDLDRMLSESPDLAEERTVAILEDMTELQRSRVLRAILESPTLIKDVRRIIRADPSLIKEKP